MNKILFFPLIILLFLTTTSVVSASEGLSIEQINNLTYEEKDVLLQEQGFSKEELEKLNLHIKDDLLLNGGQKVESELVIERSYIDIDGNEYSYEDYSKEEISQARTRDLKEFIDELDVSDEMGSFGYDEEVDDIWSGHLTVAKTGETSNHYIYTVYNDYNYSSRANFTFTDRIANAWQVELTPRASNGVDVSSWAIAMVSGELWDRNSFAWEFEPVPYGLDVSYDLSTHSSQNLGFSYDLLAHKDNETHRTAVYSTYVHPWTPTFFDFTIGAGSISVGGTNLKDVWNLAVYFNIGE
ncbi:hypothetical protein HXA35_01095 [Bacillus sp. A301a_S52]|jgi:hypothetical protein|nr:hypothetical protein [Bacillus sp. A301a_S52]